MDSVFEKISLREIFKAFLPAFYFIIFFIPIIKDIDVFKVINYDSFDIYSTLLMTIFTVLLGILISAIDLPKHFFPFQNILPNRIVAKEMGCLENPHDVDVNYYLFCNKELTEEEKSITQKYTNYYHFCFNMAVSSFILLILYILSNSFCESYVSLTLLVFLMSAIGIWFLLYGKDKVRDQFARTLKRYKESDNFEKLKEKLERK